MIIRKLKLFCYTALLSCLFAMYAYADDYAPVTDSYTNLAIVSCPKYMNIRQKPTLDSAIVGLVETGAGCEVLQEGQTWCAIKSGSISGYVMRQYLITEEEAVNKAEQLAVRKIEFTEMSAVYSSMNVNSKVWERPVAGVVYEVADDTGTWVKIDLDGAVGYVLSDGKFKRVMRLDEAQHTYDIASVDGTRKNLVQYAMRFLGNPYVWGGNDPNTGVDCSGFVKYVYQNVANITLPRTSYTQCYSGKRISSLQMLPGDLIFYADSAGEVGHVAMYVGNGTIIHAASAKSGIKLSPWNYRTPKYIRSILEE